jgi:hypothetical protein
MARPTLELVAALRTTAARLETDVSYRWSHYGECNCGHLAQTITKLSPREIYDAAFQRPGDWGEQAAEHCGTTGYPLDFILEQMLALGLDREDIRHLERLSDARVLAFVGASTTGLAHNRREDVVRYMRGMAAWLEARLAPAQRAEPVDELPLAAE